MSSGMNESSNPLHADLDHIFTQTEGLWEELRDQRIFITGGTGFFGCWFLESFAWANEKLGLGASVLVLSRDPELLRKKAPHLLEHPSIRFLIGDVRTFEFPVGRFSHIIHAAAAASATLNEENPLLMFDTIVEGTRRVLDFAVQCGCRKLLLTSSGAAYGKQPSNMTHIPEDYPGAPDTMDPRSAYGEGKRVSEFLCGVYSAKYGFEAKIARCFTFVGPYLPLDIHYAIGNFIRDALHGGPIIVIGDGTPYRSYMYAADLMVWLWTILFCGKSCRSYNVGSEEQTTVADLAKIVVCSVEGSLQVITGLEAEFGKAVDRYVPQTLRVREDLGLRASKELRWGITSHIDWLTADPGNRTARETVDMRLTRSGEEMGATDTTV
jgi:dTDP-glucose 4,6-dehydratase